MTPDLFYGLFVLRTALAEGVVRKGSRGAQTRRAAVVTNILLVIIVMGHPSLNAEYLSLNKPQRRHAVHVRLSEGLP